jgi:oxygen-independent coproporphyrinogen-3 oxidase
LGPYPADIPSNRQPPAGLYVHIPFCVKKCVYCDFYSITDTSLIDPFTDALRREMALRRQSHLSFDTLYLGGGTPSILKAQTIGRILEAAGRSFEILDQAEITLEVNPGTVNTRRLKAYRELNINRLSIGAQSFQRENLAFLQRIHSVEDIAITLNGARKAGFDNISLDLIYGLPGQTAQAWLADLEKALMYAPEHLSCYMLTYEPDTPLGRDLRRKKVPSPDEAVRADLFACTIDFLGGRGYELYEVSNFARSESRQSRHNWKYWRFAPYIGLGPSAHSFMTPQRSWNKSDVRGYIKDLQSGTLPQAGKEVLSAEQQMMELIYLGLRTRAGIDLKDFEAGFDLDFKARFEKTLRDLESEGYALFADGRFKLTSKGLRFADSITAALI